MRSVTGWLPLPCLLLSLNPWPWSAEGGGIISQEQLTKEEKIQVQLTGVTVQYTQATLMWVAGGAHLSPRNGPDV